MRAFRRGQFLTARYGCAMHHETPIIGRMRVPMPALNLILLVLGLMFLAEVVLDRTVNAWQSGGSFAGEDIGGLTLFALGADSPILLSEGAVWRAMTSVFLHAGLLHFLMNCFALWQLGRAVQVIFGGTLLLTSFLFTGLVASLVSDGWFALQDEVGFSVGASGAVCGLMGLLIGHFRRRTDIVAQALRRQLITWAIVNLVLGLVIPNVNNAAHLGGFVAGYCLDEVLEGRRNDIKAKHIRFASLVLSLAAIAALAWGAGFAVERSHEVRAELQEGEGR
jgi:rhomboid protease GluP